MEAVQSPLLAQSAVVERLAEQLKNDCGSASRVEITDDGASHAQTQRKFTIVLIGKKQSLLSLFNRADIEILQVMPKRSGAEVRTTISLKVVATC